MSAPGPTSLIYQENTIESPSPNGQPIEKTLVAASAPRVTAFPPLTGRRTTASGGSITIRTFESKISLPDLQEAARRHNASLAAIPQLAWAKLLQAYTGSKDGVVFHSILPSGRDEYTTDLASQITSVPNALVQEEDVAIGRVLCQLSEDVLRSTHRQNTIQNPDEVEKTEQQKGTLLGLGHLTEYVRGCRTLDDQCHRRPRYSAALCLELFGSTAGFLSLTVSGWSSLIDNDAAQLLLAHFEQTLEVVLTCPDKTFGEAFTHYPAPLMSVSNVKPTVPATFSSLQCQFEDTAESEPQRVALEFWTDRGSQLLQPDTVWTYSELDEKAGTLAAHLQDYFGSLIGHIVPICMDRCPETYVAVLAILKVGGAWCPIDPSFPTLRRHDLIARTGAKALIVNAQSPQGGIPQDVIAVDMSRIDWSSPKQFKRMTVASDSLAYLIWTSGTTGAPKGVPICHHAAASSMRALQACIPTDVKQGNVRCLQFSQFTFDVFIQDLFFTWGVGGTLISADRATMLGSFSGLSTKAAATHAHLTPAFAASLPRKYCPTLEVVTMIGEKLTQSVADDWSKDCQLYNTYGPAEATVVSTFRLVPYGDKMQSANVGLPLPSVSAFVIHNGGLVLKHGIGELALGGPQLSKGYWKDTTRTKERFVWNEHLQTTLYMTGDIVRQLHDGTFEFVGRTDDLIKIQGIRVELSEIAFALRSCHPQVRQVEVSFLKRVDRPSKVIVAFLAAPTLASYNRGIIEDEGGVEVARKALEVAKAQLPEYMIPKVFLVVDSISRTSSAKVDRAAMEQLYANVNLGPWEKKLGSTGSEGEAADLSPRELVIMGLISELTGTSKEAMSRQSTLPSIGVDSISATRLVTKMNAQCMAVSVAEILKCSTLDDLLRHSREGCSKTAFNAFDLSAFHHDVIGFLDLDLANHVELVMPVLPLQESLLSESFQNPSSYWSHHFFELRSDEVDVKRLEKGWEDVAQCTDALRTSFCPTADIPRKFGNDITFVQLIHKNALIDWLVISCSETCFKARARDRAREIAEQCQAKRFTRPLWAITLFSLESRTVMMFSIHHALRDEPSLNIIMSDLRDAYTGDPASPVKDRHQLRDAIRLLHTTDGDQGEQAEQFWAKSLSSFADGYESKSWPELRLADTGQSEGTLTYSWNAETSYSDLRVRAASLGAASLAAVLRTVWGCILLEYLETDKVVFAETWSARGQAAELSGAVAPLVFVLPVPFQAQGTWRKALESTTDLQQQSKTHYGVHPSRIRKILSRPGGVALYPAVFNFVPDAAEQRHDNDESLWRRIDDVVELSIEHAIAFNAFVADSGTLKLELTALKQCMDQEHLHVLSQQVMALLDLILDNPDGPVTQLSTQLPQTLLSLTPIEKDPAPNLAWTRSPTECVDHFAVIHPHWIAAEVVSFFDWNGVTSISWSYEQLQKAYQNVAAMIGELGYRRRRIAVCLDRCLDLYAVVLGIMSTGNTYLPIADDLPEERKLFLLQDSDAAMLFTTRLLAFNMSSSCCTIFVEDVDYSKPVKLPSEIKPLPTDDAYLLYTSGSTGTPKGVLVSRGNVTSFIEAISHFISSHVDMKTLQCRGKWLGMASYAFDVHLLEMFFPWRHGMATVTAPRPMLLDNLELALQKLKVTHASFVPSLADNAGLDPANLPDLRYLSLGGEKISKKAIDVWSRSHVVLVNAYGPTEVTIGCCFRRVEPATNVRNIGYALPYTVAHVLRPGTMHYVLRGTSGELCLTGDLVATGYHDRPDAKGFVEDSHGKKMYRTGDRVRLMADGSFEFLGREDDQTKVRGQRVELGEVSEAVRSAAGKVEGFEAVDVVSLVAQHPSLTRPQLVTFLATQQSSTDAVSDTSTVIGFSTSDVLEGIRTCCRSTLPSFMVPDHLVRLTCLPLVSASRKVDMKQLRTIFNNIPIDDLMSSNTPESSSAHALNEEENSVRATVAEVLAVEQVGLSADSNLLQYGLDSLNAISLTFKLQRQGLQCSVSKILKNPTIRAIASGLRQRSQNGGIAHMPSPGEDLERRFRSKSKVGLDLSNAAAIRPCLPLQETLVASSLDHECEALYVNHVILELSPDVDHRKLRQAWMTTAEDHEILRTCFCEFENGFVQFVFKNSPLSFDWSQTDAVDCVLSDLRQRESHIAFNIIADIETKPPIKLTLADSHGVGRGGMLLISLHHALYDADSFSMLLDEVYVRYQGNPSTVLHTPVTALVDHIDSQRLSDAKAFWTKYLVDYKPTPISSSSEDSRSRSMSRELITSLTEMENLAASMNGTPATVMQALFGVVLAETLQTHDVVFGTILSGRTVPVENAHSILAPCITTIPQRVQIGPSSSPGDVIRSAQEGFVESLEYQHTALRDIHRWTEAKGQLFDSLFTYTRRGSKPPWSHLWREVETSMSSGFPLAVEVVADQVASCISVQCHYTAAFGTFEKANSLLERMQDLLRCLVRGEKIALKEQSPKGSEGRMPSQPNKDCWTKDEMLIRSMISDMTDLDTRSISKDASFFALGLDSIVAIQLAKRLRQHHMPCSSANVMRYPSVAELGQHIASSKTENPAPNGSVYRLQTSDASRDGLQGEVLKVYPCTPLQSSMLTQTLGSDASLYVHHHAIRFSLGDNAIGMKQAWEQVVARTEILRTGFDFSGETNTWSGIVYKRPSTIWNEYDKDTGVERAIPQIKQAVEFREVKDFARPPWRVDIVGDVFILSLHHSLYDGESMRLLFSDFWALKRCYELPIRPPFSHAAEVINQSRVRAEDYWVQRLVDFQGGTVSSSLGIPGRARMVLEVNVADVIEGCKKLQVTLQSVALLAFGKTISWLSGRQDVVFGHVVRGRTLLTLEADEIIGPLFNTVPVRVNLEEMSTTNQNAAQGIQRTTGESQANQHASLSKVQKAWREQVGNPDAELFDSLFVFQRRAAGEEDLSWESVAVDEDLAPTEYMTNFEFEHTDTEINICVNSRTIQDPETIIQNFQHNLCDVLQCPGNPAAAVLRDLPRLNGAISHHTEVSKPGTQTGPDPTADMLGIVRRLLAKVSGIKVENIAENASIFSIGLDSISAIQVAASARKEGLGLTVADVLRGRTPKGICQSIVQRQDKAAARGHQTDSTASEVTSGTAQAPELLHTLQETSSKALALAGLRDDDVEEFSPCLPGQYYHLLAWLQSGRTLGEGTFMYSCKEALDPNRLFSAWRTLRERHATLRTVFVSTTKTEVMQAVLKPAAVRSDAFQCIEFTPFGVGAERELLKQTACRRFDLFSPPVELFLARDNVAYRHVVLKLHHALYDAWTIGTIVDELSALYQRGSLPPIPRNASLVRSVLHSVDDKLSREYWRTSLDGCQETILSSASQPPKEVRKSFFFTKTTIPDLRQLETRCQQYNTSLPIVILVAFARALAHSLAVNNPIFGIFQTGRSCNIEGLAESCVPCLNMTPLIVRGALTRDCKASIEDIQSDLAARVPFEQSSLHDVFEWTGWGQRPLFNTFVNILWSTEVESRSLASEEPLLSPWTMEDLEDVAPSFRLPGRTAIDGLDTSLLADENLFLDVRRCASENELRIVVRCDYGVLDEEEAGEFVGRIVDEVAGCVDSGLEGRD